MRRRAVRFVLPGVAVAATVAFTAGGWATITVADLPDTMVAGEAVDLAFTIRQHGMRGVADLEPVVDIRSGESREKLRARPTEKLGQYVARVTLPRPGEWSITIHSSFGDSKVALLPMLALGTGSHPTPAISQPERGRRLFVAKGCLTCHVHGEVEASGAAAVGPALTKTPLPAEYLARALADPTIIPRRTQWEMPDLELKPEEIAALVAFLKRDGERGDR